MKLRQDLGGELVGEELQLLSRKGKRWSLHKGKKTWVNLKRN